jgi:hypothetical protein
VRIFGPKRDEKTLLVRRFVTFTLYEGQSTQALKFGRMARKECGEDEIVVQNLVGNL